MRMSPAAGRGVRARPYTTLVPKGTLQVDVRPNLERSICLMGDALQIDEIYMTVDYRFSVIKEYFKDGSQLGVRLHYIDNTEVEKGLAWSILLVGRQLSAPCCAILSDECSIGSNQAELLWWRRGADVGCTFRAGWSSRYQEIRDRLYGLGPELLAEMIIEIMCDRKRMIEIPVNYFNRSEAMNARYRNRKTFLRILSMIAGKWLFRKW